MISPMMDFCAATPDGVRCVGHTELGPLASAAVTSPTVIWGFVYVCGVGKGGAFLCSKPFADKPPKGPPHLTNVVSVDLHAAAHTDGTLSVTANTDFTGYADPMWTKVKAVKDAVAVASSWYASESCYVRRGGQVACVHHAPGVAPVDVGPVTDAARIWKTDQALWVLTTSGRLLGTHRANEALQEVATSVVDFAPNAAAVPGAVEGNGDSTTRPEVPCAAIRDAPLRCGLDRTWNLVEVPGAGIATRVFGGSDWICATDAGGTVRCVDKRR
jgi:hypothetical protein